MKLPRFLRLASWVSFAFGAICLGWVAFYHAAAAILTIPGQPDRKGAL